MIAPMLIAALAAPPGSHLEVLEAKYEPRCQAQSYEPARVLGSGRVAVRYHGTHCEGWAWVRVKVTVSKLAAAHALKTGEMLEGATQQIDAELRPGDEALAALPQGARAASDIPAGAIITADRVRVGPPPGASIEVLIQAGAIAVQQSATIVGCSKHGGEVCAALPSGKRVSGRLEQGLLVVDFGGAP
jgi:hypothetical protein